MKRELAGFALGALVAVTALGAALTLRNQGVEFPDGSVQTTAAVLPAASAVQGAASANIPHLSFCSSWQTLSAVPAGKRLAIEWVSVYIRTTLGALADPVELSVRTRSGATAIVHPLVRLRGSEQIPGSIFLTQLWNSTVRLYSDGGRNVEIRACRGGDPNDFQNVTVTFSGHLADPI